MIYNPNSSRPCCRCHKPLERYRFGPDKRYVRAYKLGNLHKLVCHACYIAQKREATPRKPKISALQRAAHAKAARAYVLRLQGRSYSAIANTFHTTPRQVYRWIKAHEKLVVERAKA